MPGACQIAVGQHGLTLAFGVSTPYESGTSPFSVPKIAVNFCIWMGKSRG